MAERIANLQQDAALAWRDPAYLHTLGRTAVGELRYQGERRGWDETQTNSTVRQGLSDLYAGAIEQAIGQDLDGAEDLYEHARDVIQPERQAVAERKMERAREERGVSDVMGRLAGLDDPTRRPDLADYQARAAELTPPDASPEVRGQVNRMVQIEHAQADRAWQLARGRAAVAALDWLGKNPAVRLLAMPAELRDGLNPEQTEALDRAVINGGRIRTVADLYGNLAHQAVADPEGFASIQLDQHRLALSDVDYTRLAQWQSAFESGQRDDMLVRLDRASKRADSALRQRGYDLEGPEAKEVRANIYHDVLEFDALEGRSANREDLDGIVARFVEPLVTRQAATGNVESRPSDSASEIVTATVPLTQLNAETNDSKLDDDVTSWLVRPEPDGRRQTERSPSSIWKQLTYAQQQAVDILLTRNATASSSASAEIQLAANPPAAANEDTRNYVCTQAAYACLSNTPSGAPPAWRESCLTAESLCNRIVNLTRGGPFSVDAIINFPDRCSQGIDGARSIHASATDPAVTNSVAVMLSTKGCFTNMINNHR